MWKKQLCLGISRSWELPLEEQLQIVKNAGFDGFFVVWDRDLDLCTLTARAAQLGLMFQSLHAPWGKAADMWHADEEKARLGVEELMTCVDACAQWGVPLLVVHAFIGFTEHDPKPIGLQRFSQVVTHAAKKGIKIAFENTEGEEYLDALMEHFADNDTVGFCWDTGHELCYNHGQDLLAKYGARLFCTHLNDNLGIRDSGGSITWLDDLHLLPFDGIACWQDIAARLHRWQFHDCLTFELNRCSKPGRHDNDCYGELPLERYVAEAYKRACRVAALLIRLEAQKL